jgi:hypothetical protein
MTSFLESIVRFNELMLESDEDRRRNERRTFIDPSDASSEFRRRRDLKIADPKKAELETIRRRHDALGIRNLRIQRAEFIEKNPSNRNRQTDLGNKIAARKAKLVARERALTHPEEKVGHDKAARSFERAAKLFGSATKQWKNLNWHGIGVHPGSRAKGLGFRAYQKGHNIHNDSKTTIEPEIQEAINESEEEFRKLERQVKLDPSDKTAKERLSFLKVRLGLRPPQFKGLKRTELRVAKLNKAIIDAKKSQSKFKRFTREYSDLSLKRSRLKNLITLAKSRNEIQKAKRPKTPEIIKNIVKDTRTGKQTQPESKIFDNQSRIRTAKDKSKWYSQNARLIRSWTR